MRFEIVIGILGAIILAGASFVYKYGLAPQHMFTLLILLGGLYLYLSFFMWKQSKLLKSFNTWQVNHVKVHEDLNEKLKQVYGRLK